MVSFWSKPPTSATPSSNGFHNGSMLCFTISERYTFLEPTYTSKKGSDNNKIQRVLEEVQKLERKGEHWKECMVICRYFSRALLHPWKYISVQVSFLYSLHPRAAYSKEMKERKYEYPVSCKNIVASNFWLQCSLTPRAAHWTGNWGMNFYYYYLFLFYFLFFI